MKLQVGIGDWVRFYQNGVLVIGQVEYEIIGITNQRNFCTDVGAVCEDCVLEVRGSIKINVK